MPSAPKVINGGIGFYQAFMGFLPAKMAVYRTLEIGTKFTPLILLFWYAGKFSSSFLQEKLISMWDQERSSSMRTDLTILMRRKLINSIFAFIISQSQSDYRLSSSTLEFPRIQSHRLQIETLSWVLLIGFWRSWNARLSRSSFCLLFVVSKARYSCLGTLHQKSDLIPHYLAQSPYSDILRPQPIPQIPQRLPDVSHRVFSYQW